MRIVVTGGSGRIGSAVVRELVARGHHVTNLDRRQAAEPLAQRFVYADLTRREQVQPALEGADAVAHLGEISNVHFPISPEEIFALNTRAGSVVMQTAADLGVGRVIYTSSCQVYGMWDDAVATPQRLPFDETQPVAPYNGYAAAKAANESYARLLARQHAKMSIAVFRFPWVVTAELSEGWIDALRRPAARTDGFQTYCHASDAARAYALAIENPRPGWEAYHFTAAEIASFVPLAERLRAHHPDFPPLPADWPPFKSPVSTDKARQHFGWEPRWNLLEQHRAGNGGALPPSPGVVVTAPSARTTDRT